MSWSVHPKTFANRFARAERGATAVEFALVSVPLLALILGVVELAMVMLVVTTLDGATERAARMIRTGEFQTSANNSRADFKGLVCGYMSWLSSQCNSKLTVDVRMFDNFAALAGSQPMTGQNFNPASSCFAAGQPGDIVLVRTYFSWPLFVPLMNVALDNTGHGDRLISTATAFRNEPYNSNPAGGAAC